VPKRERDLWTTRALTGPLWEKGVPAFSLLWLSEPDYSQHHTGPGSKTSLAGIKSSDDNLARVLRALEHKGVRDTTDVIVVADHGFSTTILNVDIAAVLRQNGFHAAREFPGGPKEGDIVVVGNSGSIYLYVTGHLQDLVERAVHFLQRQPFCGVVFARQPVEGAFALAAGRINSEMAPDIALVLRWTAEKSQTGTPGLLYCDIGEYGPGRGIHASLSPFDMHNTCIAAGPDFRKGFKDELPTGNLDIAPTILWLLGVEPKQKLSGRILSEALTETSSTLPQTKPVSRRLEASYRGEDFMWRQYLECVEFGGEVYLMEGNGSVERGP
jgi:arylsulfatase A-like enzyme